MAKNLGNTWSRALVPESGAVVPETGVVSTKTRLFHQCEVQTKIKIWSPRLRELSDWNWKFDHSKRRCHWFEDPVHKDSGKIRNDSGKIRNDSGESFICRYIRIIHHDHDTFIPWWSVIGFGIISKAGTNKTTTGGYRTALLSTLVMQLSLALRWNSKGSYAVEACYTLFIWYLHT